MPVHHGGKVGDAGKKLVSKKTSKSIKRKASKILNEHKQKQHKKF